MGKQNWDFHNFFWKFGAGFCFSAINELADYSDRCSCLAYVSVASSHDSNFHIICTSITATCSVSGSQSVANSRISIARRPKSKLNCFLSASSLEFNVYDPSSSNLKSGCIKCTHIAIDWSSTTRINRYSRRHEHATSLDSCPNFCFRTIDTINQSHGEYRYDALAISTETFAGVGDADRYTLCCKED